MPNVNRHAPRKTHTQSVLFANKDWTKETSESWLRSHNYYHDSYDKMENFMHWRQYDPEYDVFEYRNQKIDSDGKEIRLAIGYMKNSGKDDKMNQGIFLRAMASDSKEAVIDIVGVIGWDVGYQQMRDILKSIPDTCECVYFDIYSPGGDVWEGNGIMQDIGNMKQKTVARVQVAASMATLIACACKERRMAGNGRWLIHNPWTQIAGDASNLEKRAKELRDCEDEAANFYAKCTKKKPEEMKALMGEERWLTAKEAQDVGFIESVDDPFDMKAFATVKAEIEAKGLWPKALVEIKEEVQDVHAVTEGAADAEATPVVVTVQPADEKKEDPSAAIEAARIAERAAGEVACAKMAQEYQDQLSIKVSEVKALQSAKDKAAEQHKKDVAALESKLNELTESLKGANERINRMLAGGMNFSPEITTWEDALKACKGVYEDAARKYPELRNKYNEMNKRR